MGTYADKIGMGGQILSDSQHFQQQLLPQHYNQ